MKIQTTYREIMNSPLLGAWDMFCEDTGMNEWAIAEGMADPDDPVTITLEQARRYGMFIDGETVQ